MADFSAIRDGIQTRIETITGLRAYSVWPDTVNAPAVLVKPLRWGYRRAIGNVNQAAFELLVIVSMGAGLARAQAALDAYLDDTGVTSIKAAIEGGKTLGGIVDTLVVDGWRDYDSYEINGVDYLGAKINLEVWA